MDFMFIGQCGSLVLERFSAAVANEAIDPFAVPVQKSSATVGHVPRRISCVCSQRRFDATPHVVHYALNHGNHFVELRRHVNQNGRNSLPSKRWSKFSRY